MADGVYFIDSDSVQSFLIFQTDFTSHFHVKSCFDSKMINSVLSDFFAFQLIRAFRLIGELRV